MQRYIILDRDGTIIEDRGYVYEFENMVFLPQAIEGLRQLQNRFSFKFIIMTNQAGIARGLYTSKDVEIFHKEFLNRLKKEKIQIEKIYYCPHHPDFTGECQCRKPAIGMVNQAMRDIPGFIVRNSIVIGDKDSDIKLGKNIGARTILVDNGQYQTREKPDAILSNLLEASEVIGGWIRFLRI